MTDRHDAHPQSGGECFMIRGERGGTPHPLVIGRRRFAGRWGRAAVYGAVLLRLAFGPLDVGGETVPDRPLIIGIKEAPPFVIKNADGTWSGISIDLWRNIAAELHRDYEFRELDLSGLLQGVQDGSLDAAVAALTVTPEREATIDFTHPFHTSGLGIAVATRKGRWLGVLRTFFSWTFLKIVLGLFTLLLVVGTFVWLLERRHNREQFGGKMGKGLGDGLWWSAVTMTTVGYGDKAPRTPGGRLVAVIWMFASIILISGFTAALASVLTTAGLESQIRGPESLPHVRVATVKGTTSEEYLRRNRIRYRAYDSPDAALKAVETGRADAAVYDAPILRYLVKEPRDVALHVLPRKFERQDYAIGLPSGSKLREEINRILLQEVINPNWEYKLSKYLGD